MKQLGPKEIKGKAQKLYQQNKVLRADLSEESIFPWSIGLKPPSAKEVLESFEQLRSYSSELKKLERSPQGKGLTLEYKELNHRQLGKQLIPCKATFQTRDDLLRFLGKKQEFIKRFESIIQTTEEFPSLASLLKDRPQIYIENENKWEKILSVLRYFQKNPRPNVYLRSLSIPGVDTKFFEQNKKVLDTLLSKILPAEAIQETMATERARFEKKFHLKYEPTRIRFRPLDSNLRRYFHGLQDLTCPAEDLASLDDMPCHNVFICENKMTGLAFPDFPEALVIFGLGHSIDILKEIPWPAQKSIYYWGDIDTHGLFILSRLRQFLPSARSLLMDKETLLENKEMWGKEGDSGHFSGPLDNLTSAEQEVYQGLITHKWGDLVRLEQERIPFQALNETLKHLP